MTCAGIRLRSIVDTQPLRLMCRMQRMLSLSKTASMHSSAACTDQASPVEQNRTYHCLIDLALCTRPKTVLQTKDCGTARLILFLTSTVSEPFVMNMEPRYLYLSTSSPSSRTAWRCSPRMIVDITLVFDALMRMPTVAAWWFTALNRSCVSV